MPAWPKAFDAVLLISVVEHVQMLDALLAQLAYISKDGALLTIEHPDVARFSPNAGGPFQEFSTEHINYFSPVSLGNLARKHGFARIHTSSEDRQATRGVMVPSSTSIFRKEFENSATSIIEDTTTEQSLTRYIAGSQEIENRILAKIEDLVRNGTEIIVWGVGTHTQHLMQSTTLGRARVAAFVDSNPRYQGKQLNGIRIVAPSQLKGMSEPILISSMIFQGEILREIREVLRITNPTILLYDSIA